jgi:polyhydroxyalkanoate synthesis regulator phasin
MFEVRLEAVADALVDLHASAESHVAQAMSLVNEAERAERSSTQVGRTHQARLYELVERTDALRQSIEAQRSALTALRATIHALRRSRG